MHDARTTSTAIAADMRIRDQGLARGEVAGAKSTSRARRPTAHRDIADY
jgi:hypothetical protein